MKRINLYPPSFLLTRQMAIFAKGGRGDFMRISYFDQIPLNPPLRKGDLKWPFLVFGQPLNSKRDQYRPIQLLDGLCHDFGDVHNFYLAPLLLGYGPGALAKVVLACGTA